MATYFGDFPSSGVLPAGLSIASPTGFVIGSTDKPTYSGVTGSLEFTSPGASRASRADLSVTVSATSTVSFWVKTSTELNFDKLQFLVDLSAPSSSTWSGTTAWTQVSFSLSAGTHALRWEFSKDAGGDSGSDKVWIAGIEITNAGNNGVAPNADLGSALTFEDGSMPSSISTSSWTNSTDSPVTGTRSLRSPASPANSGSYDATVTVPNKAATSALQFDYKVDSEPTFDKLSVLIGGSPVWTVSSLNSGVPLKGRANILIPSGTTSVVLRYSKDGSGAGGADAAWVDGLQLPNADGGGSQTIALGQASETDTAQPMLVGRVIALGQAQETDTAQPINLAGSAQTVPLGQAVETDVAQTILVGRRVALGQAVETDTAQTIRVGRRIALGQAQETDAARTITPAITIVGGSSTVAFSVGAGHPEIQSFVTLTLLDDELVQAPTSAQVTVSGALPGADLTFAVDGTDVWTDVADAEGQLGQASIPIPDGLVAGTHTITVTTTDTGSDSADFTLSRNPAYYPDVQVPDADPVAVPDSAGRWVLQDLTPGGLGSWVMTPNPSSMSNPHFERSVNVEHSTSVHAGQYHASEAGLFIKPWKVSGYCPGETFYNQLVAYAGLRRRFYVIDHRGRAWKVAVVNLSVEPRKRQSDAVSSDNDWAGNWTLDLAIYDQGWVVPA